MRIYKWIIIIVLAISTIFVIAKLLSTHLGLPISGDYISPNIKDAKKKGILISEYTLPSFPYKVNDTLLIHLKEAWLENDCYYNGKTGDVTIQEQGYKLLINTDEDYKNGLGISWRIVTDDNRYFYGQNGIPLVQDFNSPLSDTLHFKVENSAHTIIGKLILVKVVGHIQD